ncbi:hypothetical protein EV356DRAFT_529531 [Viridothelium virens]|uniref:Uncharacterized protein n=1 Tax=Viridothelium virens TaxID=1048519 RepID=A0A6A6HIV1_VIRVR|nr:hypothetical protein EV356DRAFT_529531 [Viridothelium virens]
MSMDAGGLAQMTYNNNFSNGNLGMPGNGYAARGKGSASNFKRLSVALPPKVNSIDENQVDGNPTPRTSRSHLLAGLRTAPKTPAAPVSAPYDQQSQQRFGLEASKHADMNTYNGHSLPQTAAIGNGFSGISHNQLAQLGRQGLSYPEQILAPPSVYNNFQDGEQMDPDVLAELMRTELHLAQRQQQLQQLQQQLMNLGSQQYQSPTGYNSNMGFQSQQFPNTPVTPSMSFYQQQLQNGCSPVTQEVPGQPGLHVVYNPMTSQYSYVMDPSMQTQLANSPPPSTPSYTTSPPKSSPPTFQPQPHSANGLVNHTNFRIPTPPKQSPSPPSDVEPLPPPSANAFRRGHKKAGSSVGFSVNTEARTADGPKSAFTRPVGFPATPQTGTFGPGQGRAGEHPIRQPRGPPPLDELKEKPTARFEGSKNFATRQRRRALHSLVRAGLERNNNGGIRGVVRTGSGSLDGDALTMSTPTSEKDAMFGSSGSDNESEGRSSSVSSRPSLVSLGSAHGAIGSEVKEASRSRERVWRLKDNLAATVAAKQEENHEEGARRAPMLVLTTAAEKRKTGGL